MRMIFPIIISFIVGGFCGWLLRECIWVGMEKVLRRGDRLLTESEELLRDSYPKSCAGDSFSNRMLIDLLEGGHAEEVKKVVAASVADFYQRWTQKTASQT